MDKETLRKKLDILSHAHNESILSERILERSSKWMEESVMNLRREPYYWKDRK